MLRVSFARVHPGKVDKLRSWLTELMERRSEVLESFVQEGALQEQAYLVPDSEGFLLVYVMDARDTERARAVYQASTLPIDVQHRALLAECLAERLRLSPSYSCSVTER